MARARTSLNEQFYESGLILDLLVRAWGADS
jgi:hypothetical protein